ncbi:hypothetical protein [Streptomyces sp. NPDC002922]|uniref:hypothetical protein n=1 Tax=Streptomyces sp. NPDC002922 TaxID=3154439 RepID=UPI0033A035AC
MASVVTTAVAAVPAVGSVAMTVGPRAAVSSLGAVGDAAGGATGALGHAVSPVTQLQLDPLAGTGVDPLANGVGTQVADFKPLSTGVATDPLTSGGALKDLPVVGEVAGLLHG